MPLGGLRLGAIADAPPKTVTAGRQELVDDINAYLAERNADPKPYKWKAEGATILHKIHRARAALDKAQAA